LRRHYANRTIADIAPEYAGKSFAKEWIRGVTSIGGYKPNEIPDLASAEGLARFQNIIRKQEGTRAPPLIVASLPDVGMQGGGIIVPQATGYEEIQRALKANPQFGIPEGGVGGGGIKRRLEEQEFNWSDQEVQEGLKRQQQEKLRGYQRARFETDGSEQQLEASGRVNITIPEHPAPQEELFKPIDINRQGQMIPAQSV
jgi:hypothetical protein